ncbi:aliphatic sulfonate ABC transporter substrate-binding protein [Leptolyngbya ohadii]|uniref:aliphatic sulfonate ABC transporter substrate-binding protein n=1 Tax=Leptolyngbya ohadii TaxID=1962290 RepID=UPI000B59A5B2|nr:aliphatic sulfonate ABC transporter substrate-binding protein [Leptolyngbya ohadii]
MQIKRRTFLSGLVGLSLPFAAASCTSNSSNSAANLPQSASSPVAPSPNSSSGTTVRIGYQKATELDLLRSRGNLDQQLKEQGVAIEWALFPSGPPMLEAMNAGKIDFGGVGESPPIFAQAGGGQFYYVSVTPLSPQTQDIVVRKDSPIQSAADLKGKRIAFQKGSSAHYLLLKVLEEQGISVKDIEAISLPPADARAAFEQGNVDAWSIWDPFLAVAEGTGTIRNLSLGRERRTYFLASQQFANNQPESVKTILAAAKENGQWAKQNFRQVAEQFSGEIKVDAKILEKVYQRRSWEVLPVDAQIQQAQQQVADAFYKAQIIPNSLDVKTAFLASEGYGKVFPN